MRTICPYCEDVKDVEVVDTTENIKVKGELIEVPVTYYKCSACSGTFDDPKTGGDPLERAYMEYRSRHGMIQPAEFKEFRKRHGLTQAEFNTLLGWGKVTVNRYESGALQDEAHDKEARLAMDPRNLINLIEETPSALSDQKRARLLETLRREEEETFSFERIFEERFGKYEASELSGYRRLNVPRVLKAILFFCKGGDFKTKVNKLLFYADFSHFKENTTSITGAHYAHATHGPVPDNYELYFAHLVENGSLKVEEVPCGSDHIAERLITVNMPDLFSLFSESDVKTLISVKEFFRDYTATAIRDFSHREKGYQETTDGQPISYEYADALQI
ncbi:MAG: hypothetical protein A4E61_00340 [Syntrophorhabdus sp. PtaB.Bin184]|nr:MAG: hypothetical protein A4E61_00340 [Syntrophorhabdus sp. PtaB.Bin184]